LNRGLPEVSLILQNNKVWQGAVALHFDFLTGLRSAILFRKKIVIHTFTAHVQKRISKKKYFSGRAVPEGLHQCNHIVDLLFLFFGQFPVFLDQPTHFNDLHALIVRE